MRGFETLRVYHVRLLGVFTFFVIVILFVFGVMPQLLLWLDAYRFQEDINHVNRLNTQFQTMHEADTVYDAHAIRTLFSDAGFDTNIFTAHAHDTGVFYLTSEKRLVVMRFEEALRYGHRYDGWWIENGNPPNTYQFFSPSQVFGEDIILLSREGSQLAREINHLYQHALGWHDQSPSFEMMAPGRFLDRVTSYLLELTGQLQKSPVLESYLISFYTHFDPSTTLFVSDYRWVTSAQEGNQINSLVFTPGMTTIPAFTLQRFQAESIRFDELRLPPSIVSIQTGAFPAAFIIERLHVIGDDEVFVESNALTGVSTLNWQPTLYNRDNPQYEIKDWFQGRPLVWVEPFDEMRNPNLELGHLRRYFEQKGLTSISFTVRFNLSDMTRSRVYVYSSNGYEGYVIPVFKEE